MHGHMVRRLWRHPFSSTSVHVVGGVGVYAAYYAAGQVVLWRLESTGSTGAALPPVAVCALAAAVFQNACSQAAMTQAHFDPSDVVAFEVYMIFPLISAVTAAALCLLELRRGGAVRTALLGANAAVAAYTIAVVSARSVCDMLGVAARRVECGARRPPGPLPTGLRAFAAAAAHQFRGSVLHSRASPPLRTRMRRTFLIAGTDDSGHSVAAGVGGYAAMLLFAVWGPLVQMLNMYAHPEVWAALTSKPVSQALVTVGLLPVLHAGVGISVSFRRGCRFIVPWTSTLCFGCACLRVLLAVPEDAWWTLRLSLVPHF